MKLHSLLLTVFALMNGLLLYLFLLHLPFSMESFLLSLAYWDRLSPRSGLVAFFAVGVAIIGLLLAHRLAARWKNRLLYARWSNPHPARDAFLTTRKQPFEHQALLSRYPDVKDSGFDPAVQVETWRRIYPRYREHPVITSTLGQWTLFRDLYLIALLFALVFLLSWPFNGGVPFQIASSYVFVYGAQLIFLFFMGRRVGLRLVDNLLGLALGVEPDQGLGKKQGK